MSPLCKMFRARKRPGKKRNSWSSKASLPLSWARWRICAASRAFIAIGFSHKTCLPASNAANAIWQWVAGGEAMLTKSTSG